MRAISEMCAGASALAIMAACITWGTTSAHVSVGYLGVAAVSASLALAIDWGRR